MKIIGNSVSLLSVTFLIGNLATSCTGRGEDIASGRNQRAGTAGDVEGAKPSTGDAQNQRKKLLDRLHSDYNEVMENRRLMMLSDADLRKGSKPKRGEASEYTPIRIQVDDSPLRARIAPGLPNAPYNAAILALADKVLPQVVEMIESTLYVKAPMNPVDLRNRGPDCGGVTLPVEPLTNDDFHIIFDGVRNSENSVCNSYQNLAALSDTCAHDFFPLNPRAGIIRSCLDSVNVGLDGMVADEEVERLVSLYLGEMAVALGATSELFSFYNDPTTEEPYGYAVNPAVCLDGSIPRLNRLPAIVQQDTYGSNAKPFFEVTTPMVTQVARNIFDCQSLGGARIENQPFKPSVDAGTCIGDGWDSRLFYEEVLATHVDASEAKKVLSPLTLALLEDSGWYKVDFSRAGALSFGLGAGCSFVNDDCLDLQGEVTEVSTSSQGIFCADTNEHCDFSYRSVAFCNADSVSPPAMFRYFEDINEGGQVSQADYCPLVRDDKHFCEDNTRCFEVVDDEPECLAATCDDGEVIFVYNDVAYTCTSDFEEIELTGLDKKVQCPRIAAFCPSLGCPAACSGRGVCTFQKAKCSCEGQFDNDGCFSDLGGGGEATAATSKKGKKRGRGRRNLETQDRKRRSGRKLKGAQGA